MLFSHGFNFKAQENEPKFVTDFYQFVFIRQKHVTTSRSPTLHLLFPCTVHSTHRNVCLCLPLVSLSGLCHLHPLHIDLKTQTTRARQLIPTHLCNSVNNSSLHIYDGQEGYSFLFNSFGNGTPWLQWSENEQWALLYAQNYTMIIWVWYMVCMSSTFMSRALSLRSFKPWKNRTWIGACILW
jgi:hypothetical protein